MDSKKTVKNDEEHVIFIDRLTDNHIQKDKNKKNNKNKKISRKSVKKN